MIEIFRRLQNEQLQLAAPSSRVQQQPGRFQDVASNEVIPSEHGLGYPSDDTVQVDASRPIFDAFEMQFTDLWEGNVWMRDWIEDLQVVGEQEV
jgi:hypothetical protein